MPGISDLKRRIKSIGGMRKVTRAMQLVSAAKMRKSQQATLNSRTYSTLAWELVMNLAPKGNNPSASDALGISPQEGRNLQPGDTAETPSPFEERDGERLRPMIGMLQSFPQARKTLVLILSSNRGLVGSLNTNLLNKVRKETESSGLPADIITYGKKAREWSVRSHKTVLADFEKYDRTITTEDISPISQLISNQYQTGKYKSVSIFYNHYVSTIVQQPRMKQLLPFGAISEKVTGNSEQAETSEYLFEPSPSEVLDLLLPRIIESQIYQTILESEASEQSARMIMMKNATDAAGDLISDLTLTYNKLRQGKITTELSEITAGKIALE